MHLTYFLKIDEVKAVYTKSILGILFNFQLTLESLNQSIIQNYNYKTFHLAEL